jgi:hypothetical protein
MKLCMERMLPPTRQAPVHVEIPPIRTQADLLSAHLSVLDSVANGEITPDEGEEFMQLIERVGTATFGHQNLFGADLLCRATSSRPSDNDEGLRVGSKRQPAAERTPAPPADAAVLPALPTFEGMGLKPNILPTPEPVDEAEASDSLDEFEEVEVEDSLDEFEEVEGSDDLNEFQEVEASDDLDEFQEVEALDDVEEFVEPWKKSRAS